MTTGSDSSPDPSALRDAAAVADVVSELGLLFLSDPRRRNAIEVLTGQNPRGSWWTHPRANDIYAILQTVEDHPDVLTAKLLAGKVTLVHRALWPSLLTVVTAREPWQTEGLTAVAAQWLVKLDEAAAAGAGAPVPPVSRTVSKEMEARLLAFSESVHTDSGKHETRLHHWRDWATRSEQPWPPDHTPAAVAAARQALEAAATRLGSPPPALPWA